MLNTFLCSLPGNFISKFIREVLPLKLCFNYSSQEAYDYKIGVHLAMSSFRLNRSAFKAQTAAEASNHSSYYKNLSWQKRLEIAAYLNSIAFNYPENKPPKLDRTIFKAVARNN